MKKRNPILPNQAIMALLCSSLLAPVVQAEATPAAANPEQAAPAVKEATPQVEAAPQVEVKASPMEQADAIYQEGNLKKMREAMPLYLKIAKEEPSNYEAQWKASRVLREIAIYGKKHSSSGWKAQSKKLGKQCMGLAEKAIAIDSSKVEGHFYYGLCVGNYADGVSIVTAVSEGLAGKTKKGFQTAYKMNKNYNHQAPIKALGRYWSVLPWPLRDRDLGVKYLSEYNSKHPNDVEGRVYLAEVLLGRDDKGDKDKAKKLLTPVRNSKNKFYKDYANRLWKDEDLD